MNAVKFEYSSNGSDWFADSNSVNTSRFPYRRLVVEGIGGRIIMPAEISYDGQVAAKDNPKRIFRFE